jgi:hypothetical protein
LPKDEFYAETKLCSSIQLLNISHLFPPHSLLHNLQNLQTLLTFKPPRDKLQTNRRIDIFPRLIQIIIKPILFIHRHIIHILSINFLIYESDGEDSSWVFEKIPLRGVVPIFGVNERRCCAWAGGTEDCVDGVVVLSAGIEPEVGVFGAVGVASVFKLWFPSVLFLETRKKMKGDN